MKEQIDNYYYEVTLWDSVDNLYHGYIYKDNPYNLIHTTGGYLSESDTVIAIKAIIEFMQDQETLN